MSHLFSMHEQILGKPILRLNQTNNIYYSLTFLLTLTSCYSL